MKKSNEFRTGRHCVFNMHLHLVFVTKYRKNIFNQAILNELKDIFIGICNSFESTLVHNYKGVFWSHQATLQTLVKVIQFLLSANLLRIKRN